MSSTMAHSASAAHRLLPETADRMAKADVRQAESIDFRAVIGACVDRARMLAGWSLKQLADAVSHDERQVARWISGAERPQFDALFAVEALRGPLVIQLAGLSESIEVITEIRVRRTA